MNEEIIQIAKRIKELREISGISLESLAKEFGVSPEKYRAYENGTEDIPVSFLYEIAGKFKVELTALLTGDYPKLHNYCLVKKGQGIEVERRKQYKYQSLAYNFMNKKAEAFLVTVDADKENGKISYNSHSGQEFNYVLEGSMKVVINDHELVLDEGDSLYFDSGQNHAMKAMNGKPAKFLAIII